mmetsp:Transcript_21888/g.72543  ORF Transcript_21888/g.72543 Transcript_21888/m.72543 type:complete len:223 (+) Transcript_21888:1158-1826(+)
MRRYGLRLGREVNQPLAIGEHLEVAPLLPHHGPVLEALRELGARRAAERGEHQPRREGGAPIGRVRVADLLRERGDLALRHQLLEAQVNHDRRQWRAPVGAVGREGGCGGRLRLLLPESCLPPLLALAPGVRLGADARLLLCRHRLPLRLRLLALRPLGLLLGLLLRLPLLDLALLLEQPLLRPFRELRRVAAHDGVRGGGCDAAGRAVGGGFLGVVVWAER